jgi:hypothetical protein
MKKIILSSILLSFGVQSFAQDNAIKKYFSSWQNDARFTKIQVNPAMFDLFEHAEGETAEEKEFLEAVESIEGLSVLSCDDCKTGSEMYTTAIAALGKSFEELILIQDGGTTVDILIRESGGIVNELVIIANLSAEGEFALVDIWGAIDLKQVMKVTKALSATNLPEIDPEQLLNAKKVNLYPNPVQSNQNLNLAVSADMVGMECVIHDLSGRELKRTRIERENQSVATQGLVPGQYVLSIWSKKGKESSFSFSVL